MRSYLKHGVYKSLKNTTILISFKVIFISLEINFSILKWHLSNKMLLRIFKEKEIFFET